MGLFYKGADPIMGFHPHDLVPPETHLQIPSPRGIDFNVQILREHKHLVYSRWAKAVSGEVHIKMKETACQQMARKAFPLAATDSRH